MSVSDPLVEADDAFTPVTTRQRLTGVEDVPATEAGSWRRLCPPPHDGRIARFAATPTPTVDSVQSQVDVEPARPTGQGKRAYKLGQTKAV